MLAPPINLPVKGPRAPRPRISFEQERHRRRGELCEIAAVTGHALVGQQHVGEPADA